MLYTFVVFMTLHTHMDFLLYPPGDREEEDEVMVTEPQTEVLILHRRYKMMCFDYIKSREGTMCNREPIYIPSAAIISAPQFWF